VASPPISIIIKCQYQWWTFWALTLTFVIVMVVILLICRWCWQHEQLRYALFVGLFMHVARSGVVIQQYSYLFILQGKVATLIRWGGLSSYLLLVTYSEFEMLLSKYYSDECDVHTRPLNQVLVLLGSLLFAYTSSYSQMLFTGFLWRNLVAVGMLV